MLHGGLKPVYLRFTMPTMGVMRRLLLDSGLIGDAAQTSAAESHHAASDAHSIFTATSFAAGASSRQVTHRAFLDIDAGGHRVGRITLKLFGKALPKTVANFVHLAKCDLPDQHGVKLCYRGSPFHRIIPGFMLQGGDFTNQDGTGGASIYGSKFADETSTL